ncbi:hypothetical protein [Micromonospora sp. DT229]|uniref:hypothetical protein n=1 Tax=Micromonospora sp. DT229 TaxID=3393430 RepID=UPI003CED6A01
MAYQPGPNDLLRAARLALRSPSGSGRPMSRQELAEAVNAWLYEHAGRRFAIHAGYIGNLERGTTRWPSAHYRTGLRAVLGRATDAELGFFIIQGHAKDRDTSMVGQAPATGRPDAGADICPASSPAATGQSATAPGGLPVASAGAAAVRVSVGSGAASVMWHEGSPGCITLVAGPLRVLIDVSGVGVGLVDAAPAVAGADAGRGARVYSLAERRAQ